MSCSGYGPARRVVHSARRTGDADAQSAYQRQEDEFTPSLAPALSGNRARGNAVTGRLRSAPAGWRRRRHETLGMSGPNVPGVPSQLDSAERGHPAVGSLWFQGRPWRIGCNLYKILYTHNWQGAGSLVTKKESQ